MDLIIINCVIDSCSCESRLFNNIIEGFISQYDYISFFLLYNLSS